MDAATPQSPAPPPPEPGEKRLEAWLSLPDGDRAELIDGRIVYKAMPSIEHGDAVFGIAEQLGRFRGPRAGDRGGWWLSQDVEVYLAGQGLRPDVVGWSVARYPAPPRKVNVGARHLGVYVDPPDWVAEVLSDSTRSRDEEEGAKWRAYFEAGVGHYWLIDLDRQQLTVYRRTDAGFVPIEVAGRGARKPLPPFEAAEFEADRVFLLAGHLGLDSGP